MLNHNNIIALMMQRQFLSQKANTEEYDDIHCDVSPVQNVYWNGFGDPKPTPTSDSVVVELDVT